MNFKEIIKEHNEIYFDNKEDLKEFLDLCAKEDITWSSGSLANEMGFVYDWFRDNGNYITIFYNNFCKLTHSTDKVDFTYNDFKKLLNPFDLAEFLKHNGVRVLDEQQFNDMFNILDKHNIKYDNIKHLWSKGYCNSNCVFHYSNNLPYITVFTKGYNKVENILSYQDFISIYNSNIITKKSEELTVTSLKQDIEKYLIKDREATTKFNDLLDFIINVNNKYNLKLNI